MLSDHVVKRKIFAEEEIPVSISIQKGKPRENDGLKQSMSINLLKYPEMT